MSTELKIRRLADGDGAAWRTLWHAYLRFYRQKLPEEVTARTLEQLLAPDGEIRGFVAEFEDRLVGFANYLFHGSTWSKSPVCYLEDLYVDSQVRGRGAGRALIRAVFEEADARGAGTVYWMTQEFNADARALYDTLAHRTSFIRYERG